MSGFAIHRRNDGVRFLAAVRGELDVASAPTLNAMVNEAILRGATAVTIDLTETVFMDSLGLRCLLEISRRIANRDGTFAVVCHDGTVREVFDRTRLHRFPIYPSRAELPPDLEPRRV